MPSPTEVAREESKRLAEAIAPHYRRTPGGKLIVPAGDLCAEPLHVPEPHLWEALLGSRSGRRWMASRSTRFFMAYHLGLDTPACQLRWIAEARASRRCLIEAPRDHGKSTALAYVDVLERIAMSSTWIGKRGFPVRGLRPDLAKANIRILLMTRGGGNARKRLQSVRQTLEGRQELVEDFGPFRQPGKPWNDSKIYCVRNTDGARLSDPTVEAVSVESAVTGGRFDHAVFDDVEDRKSVNTAEQRAKGREDLANAEELLEDDGTASAIGTRKHADDWYARQERNPAWSVHIDRAFLRWPGGGGRDETKWTLKSRREPVDPEDPTRGYKQVIEGFDVIEPGAVTLWPEKWSVEKLLTKYEATKATAGSGFFMREQQQQVVDDSSALFKEAWFARAKSKGRLLPLHRTHRFDRQVLERTGHPGAMALSDRMRTWLANPYWREGQPAREKLLIFQAWDMSLVDEEGALLERDNDYTVGLTIGLNWETKQRLLLDAFRARWIGEQAKEDAVRGHAELWSPQEIAIESNAFQAMHISHLRRSDDLPIHPHLTGGKGKKKRDPYEGVPSLSALLETRDGDATSGRLILPYSPEPENSTGRELVDVMVNELRGLGVEPHDDMLMALWIAHLLVVKFIDMTEDRARRLGLARRGAASAGKPANGAAHPKARKEEPSGVGVKPMKGRRRRRGPAAV